MANDLIARLRHADRHSLQRIAGSDIFKQAADRIEALEREKAAALGLQHGGAQIIRQLETRIEALEAALRRIDAVSRDVTSPTHEKLNACGIIARTVINSTGGGNGG